MECEPSTSSVPTSYELEQEDELPSQQEDELSNPELLLQQVETVTLRKTKRKRVATADTKVLEKITLRNKITTRFACCYSGDERLAIVTDGGVYILTLEYGMHRHNTFFTYKKKFCKHSDYVLARDYGIDINDFIYKLPQFDMYEAVLRLDISSDVLPSCQKTNIRPVLAKWSPRGLIKQNGCALASLSNVGTVEIFVNNFEVYETETWFILCNVTQHCAEVFKCDWKNTENMSNQDKYNKLKIYAEKVTCSAFTWSHLFNCDNKSTCLLFLGHLDGGISAWRFQNNALHSTDVQFNFVGYCKTKLKRLTALCWGKTSTGGVLFIGDKEGKCNALIVEEIHSATVTFKNEVEFWKDDDFIQVDWVEFVRCDKASYLLVVKNNVLVVYLINEKSVVVESQIVQCGNIHISGVQHYEEDKFVVSTWTGTIYLLSAQIHTDSLNLEVKKIAVNIPWTKYTCHGFFMSKNRVFLGFLTHPCKQKHMVRRNEFVTLHMAKNLHKNALDILMSDSVKNLRNYWDCLELLRLQAAIEKEHPAKGLPKVNYEKLPLVKLKIIMFLIRSSEVLFHRIRLLTEFKNKPTYTQIRTALEMKMIIGRIKKLLGLYCSGKISKFQLQNLCVLTVYLKNLVLDDEILKCKFGNKTVDEIYQILVEVGKIEFPEMPRCEYCHDIVISEKCIPVHYEMRCGISKMPVDSRLFYKCPHCHCNVCKEMEEEFSTIFCPYCDVIMYKRDLRSITIGKVENVEYGVSVGCHKDCDRDILDFVDVISDDETSEVEWFLSPNDSDDVDSNAAEDVDVLLMDESVRNTDDLPCTTTTSKEDSSNATDVKMEAKE